jgi:uracil-DNA glycosylase
MNVRIEQSWKEVLAAEFEKPYFIALTDFVRDEYKKYAAGGTPVYPVPANIFNAFNLCPFDKVKVVIIGQDPYHNPGEAHGLCFSVKSGVRTPPSLRNIYQEIQTDTGAPTQNPDGDLTRWAEQGVLLMNSVLSVRKNEPASHAGKGWEQFTDSVIRALAEKKDGIVYILWGSYAQKKAVILDAIDPRLRGNLVLKSAHPSPFSATMFFGNKHFSKTNEYLAGMGKEPIVW